MKKPTILSLLLLLLSDCLTAQQAHYNLNFTLSQKSFADSISIEWADDRIVVPVSINGQLLRFMLDTGAAQAIIYDDSNIENCLPAGTITAHDALGQKSEVPMVTLPPITLGTLTLSGCQATIHRRPMGKRHFDGILGFDLVCKGLSMKIDTRNNLLIITDHKRWFDKEEGYDLKYRLRPYYHTPYITIEPFKGYKEDVLFDTGSPHLYTINKESFDQAEPVCRLQRPDLVEGRAIGSYAFGLHGREAEGEVVFLCLDSLACGRFSLHELHTKTTQGGSHIGAGLLKYGTVTLLPRRKVIRFRPYDGNSRITIGNQQVEKAIGNEGGLPTVQFVWRHGKAFREGLREGDVILKADSHTFESYTDYARFRYLIGHVYTFIVRDKRGMMKEVKMEW